MIKGEEALLYVVIMVKKLISKSDALPKVTTNGVDYNIVELLEFIKKDLDNLNKIERENVNLHNKIKILKEENILLNKIIDVFIEHEMMEVEEWD